MSQPGRPSVRRALPCVCTTVGALTALLMAGTASAEKVYVLDAVDGDQVQLQREHGGLSQARLIGIEAPGARSDKRHPAKLNLGQRAFGRWGTASCDPWHRPPDKKKPLPPLLCRVEVDGHDLSVAQLEAGFARYSERFAGSLTTSERELFKAKESAAREAKKGMWIDRE